MTPELMWLTGYLVIGVFVACGRLISFYPRNPDRTVITFGLFWPLFLLVGGCLLLHLLVYWVFEDLIKLIKRISK